MTQGGQSGAGTRGRAGFPGHFFLGAAFVGGAQEDVSEEWSWLCPSLEIEVAVT